MTINLKNRNLLTLKDFSRQELTYILDLAETLKKNKQAGITGDNLAGKNIALIFEKSSTRTRCAFAVGAKDEGGKPEFLGKNDIQLGKKETISDTARVLGRMFDGIQYRGSDHRNVELLAENAGVPVWNGLTDRFHPTQILADLMTVKENFGDLKEKKIVFVGDGRNNVARSLLIGTSILGLNFTIIAPSQLQPEPDFVQNYQKKFNNSDIKVTDDQKKGVKGADVIYTDVWASMGEEEKFAQRIELLQPYQVNEEMMARTENEETIFLHCLPAYHNKNTENGQKIYQEYGLEEMEVTDNVFEGPHSRVFDQAENRLHTIKAVMVATLA